MLYPGTLLLQPAVLTEKPGQPIPYDPKRALERYNKSITYAFNYTACDEFYNETNYCAKGNCKNLDVAGSLLPNCQKDVCRLGCFHRIGSLGDAEMSECMNQCNAGKRFKNECEYLITRNLTNQQLVNAGCGDVLAEAAQKKKEEEDEEKKAAALQKLKKVLPILIILLIAIVIMMIL